MSRLFMCLWLFLVTGSALATSSEEAERLYSDAVEKNGAGLLIEASVLLTEAIAIDDQQHRYFHQRGLSYFGMGEEDHGIKDFKHAVDLKSDDLDVYLKLINHYMTQSQFMVVLIVTDQMLVNLPEQAAGAYYDKGRAYEAMNNPRLAIKAYQASIAELADDQIDFKQFLSDKIAAVEQLELKP